jgi:hypothetical protein
MFNQIIKYNVYSKIYALDTKYKNHPKIKTYKLYKRYNDLISGTFIIGLKRLHGNDITIFSLYYESNIEQ